MSCLKDCTVHLVGCVGGGGGWGVQACDRSSLCTEVREQPHHLPCLYTVELCCSMKPARLVGLGAFKEPPSFVCHLPVEALSLWLQTIAPNFTWGFIHNSSQLCEKNLTNSAISPGCSSLLYHLFVMTAWHRLESSQKKEPRLKKIPP